MRTNLVFLMRKQANLLGFLMKKPSTLLPFRSSTSSVRLLSTVVTKESSLPSPTPPPSPSPSPVITETKHSTSSSSSFFDDLGKQFRNLFLKYWNNDWWKEEQRILKIFSTTTPPRIPKILSTMETDDDYFHTERCNFVLELLYEYDQVDHARELLDEMFECDLIIGDTKEVVFDGLAKRISPLEPVDREYMMEVVNKFCDGCYPPVRTITPLIIKLSLAGYVDTAYDLVHVVFERAESIDSDCIDALLNGLGRENEAEKMILLLSEMKDLYGPKFMSGYRIVVHHLCRLEKFDEALQIVEEVCKEWQEEGSAMRSQHGYAPKS